MKLNGKVSCANKVSGKLDFVSADGTAMISSELDEFISETDEAVLETLSGMNAVEKVTFCEMCKSSILGAIADKGVTVPEVQPLRTIGALIDQIEQGASYPDATSVSFVKSGNTITEKSTLDDGTQAERTITLDDSGNPVSVVAGDNSVTIEIGYDENGDMNQITVNGQVCPVSLEGF